MNYACLYKLFLIKRNSKEESLERPLCFMTENESLRITQQSISAELTCLPEASFEALLARSKHTTVSKSPCGPDCEDYQYHFWGRHILKNSGKTKAFQTSSLPLEKQNDFSSLEPSAATLNYWVMETFKTEKHFASFNHIFWEGRTQCQAPSSFESVY